MSTDQQILEVVLELKDKLSGPLKNTGNNVKGLAAQIGGSMKSAGASMTRNLTLPIVGAGAAIIKLGMDFDKSMRSVKALSGATATEFKALTDQAKQLGITTAYSAIQAAEGQAFLAKAGFETNQILGAMPGTLDMAAAGSLDLAQAADIASNILTGFTLEATEMGRVSDVLTSTFTSANVDLIQLGESMKYVAPKAASLGLSIEEVSAAIGLLGQAGIQGSMAGTSLRMGLLNLVNPGDKAAAAMKEIGLSAVDADGNMRSLYEIISQMEAGLQGRGNAEAAALVQDIVGSRSSTAFEALVAQGSGALSDLTTANENSEGMARQVAEGMITPWQRFISAVQGAGIAIADSGLLEAFTNILTSLTPLLQKLAEADPAFIQTGVVIAGVAAAIGPLLVGLGSIITVAPAIGTAFAALAGPIGIAIAAIAAGVALVIANWDTIKGWWDANGPAIIAKAQEVFAWLGSEAIQLVQPIIDWWQENWPLVAEVFQKQLDKIKAFWDTWGPMITAAWELVWSNVKEALITVWEIIKTTVQNALAIVGGIIEAGLHILNGDWAAAWDAILEIFVDVWNNSKAFIERWWPGFKAYLDEQWGLLKAAWSGLWSGIWDTIVDWAAKIVAKAKAFAESVAQPFTWLYEKLVGHSIWPDMWEAIDTTTIQYAGRVTGHVTSMADSITSEFAQMQSAITTMATSIGEAVTSSIGGAIQSVANDVNALMNLAAEATAQSMRGGGDGWQLNTPAAIGARALGAAQTKPGIGARSRALGLSLRGTGILAGGFDPTYGEVTGDCGPGG